MVGQRALAQVGDQAKGAIEQPDQRRGDGSPKDGGWNGKLGDQPKRVGRDGWGQANGKVADFQGAEAVKEKVGDDQVVFCRICGFPGAEIGSFCGEAVGVARRGLLKGLDHARAAVDCRDFEMGVLAQEMGGETAVSVAENKGAAAIGKLRQEMDAAAPEKRAESEVFEPAIDASQMVEVWDACRAGWRM